MPSDDEFFARLDRDIRREPEDDDDDSEGDLDSGWEDDGRWDSE